MWSNYINKARDTSRSWHLKNTREREIKHIATGTKPQPRGWTTPSSSWWLPGWWRWPPVMISPSGKVLERGLDWFFVATEACSSETSDLGLFLIVSLFIGFFGVGFTRRWASRWAQPTGASQAPLAHRGGLCPPRGSSGPPMKLRGSLLFQKNHQKVSAHLENFHFCTKNNTMVVLLKTASVRVSSMQIIPKPYKIVVNMAWILHKL
jgi:hypothetical protein